MVTASATDGGDCGRPDYTGRFWAKAQPPRQQGPERIHLLEHHLADVGACFERLLMQPTIGRRMARAGRRDALDEATAARLAVFAALHDIGKVNIGFQTQVWTNSDHPAGSWRPRPAGHTNQLLPVLTDDDWETAGWFFKGLGWWDDFLTWDDQDGATVCGLLLATLSHHGRPLYLYDPNLSKHPRLWRPYGELNPQEYVARIGKLLCQWFPAAFAPGAPTLPSAPAFQHHFLGLCNLADWIGSNEEWFPFECAPDDGYIVRARRQAEDAIRSRKVGLDIGAQRKAFGGVGAAVPDFGILFAFNTLNAIQQAAGDTPLEAPVVIIESETGSGKTEAALWRLARMYAAGLVDGMYFALPTRAAAVQIHGRVEQFVTRLFPEGHRPEVVLAVPGYDAGAGGGGLPDYAAGYDSGYDGHYDRGRPWAAERPKRFLAAQIAVGTVDQAMLGALRVRNAHLRSSILARNLLVVDEAHASDVYMGAVLERLLAAHGGAGGYALLMSATLGSAARARWLGRGGNGGGDDGDGGDGLSLEAAVAKAYPAVSTAAGIDAVGENGQGKEVDISAISEMGDFDAVARRALDVARAGAKVLVIRNTVDYAINTQQRVEELAGVDPGDAGLLYGVKGIRTLHHGRFAAGDRRLLDARVQVLLGKDTPAAGVIVVGTQTLEQSLDIDADLLITDLCPVDVLLQRIGRLHRHSRSDRPAGYDKARCIVLTPAGGDLAPLLEQTANANGLGEYGGVYVDLRILEATRLLIDKHPQWRIPGMNRKLVERATHPDALDEITAARGDAWKAHANRVRGQQLADVMAGGSAVISFDQSFFADNGKVVFHGNEENIRTRLGEERVDIAFDPAPASPLDGAPIDKVAMRLDWLRRRGGVDIPEGPIETKSVAGGFEFAIGNRRFRYDQLGLRRA